MRNDSPAADVVDNLGLNRYKSSQLSAQPYIHASESEMALFAIGKWLGPPRLDIVRPGFRSCTCSPRKTPLNGLSSGNKPTTLAYLHIYRLSCT